MVMGGACNEVTKTLAEIVPWWNLVMISYAADSPALSERERYRTFFRMALGHSALDPPRRMLLEHFGWKKVAVLYEELEALSLAFNTLRKEFASHDITVTSAASLKNAALESPTKLRELKDQDVRIIVAGFSEPVARLVLCEAYQLGLTGARYVWILVGGLRRQWWYGHQYKDSSCTVDEMSEAVEGMFIVYGLNGMLQGETSIGNLTYSDFLRNYNNLNTSHPVTLYAVNSYDTVWTMALAIRDTLRRWEQNGTALPLHQLNYTQMESVKDVLIDTVESLSFSGVSGPVSFVGSDREGISVVYQLQNGNYTPVALHEPFSSHLAFDCDLCRSVIWAGGKIPKDEQMVVLRMKVVLPSVFYTALTLCMCGILMAMFFLCYNLYYRRLKFIKLSSPKLNNVAVIGCILVYCDVILLGLDDAVLTDHSYSIVCSARAFLLSSGFSLAFGAMFAKTFRVHRIFTRANRGLLKSRLIRDSHLLAIIGVLLILDMALVCTWVVVDPMNRQVYNLTRQVSENDPDLVYQDQLTTCYSDHLQKWLGAFYTYKGLLLVFGVYMAWETRQVKIPALNDSQYIGLNVYNVVIMAVCVVVISNIVSTRPNLAYAMVASFMILSTTVTLCLLFVPKICAIVTSRGNPIVASSGILVDRTNTRRFVFDDRKEVLYRAEVQNRVYKRELLELDQKVSRLERLMDIPIHPIPRLTEELLYLLPDTRGDRHSQYRHCRRKPLEWCYSISDGGEGVTWSMSESDDLVPDNGMSSIKSSFKRTKSKNSQKRKISSSQALELHNCIRSNGKSSSFSFGKSQATPSKLQQGIDETKELLSVSLSGRDGSCDTSETCCDISINQDYYLGMSQKSHLDSNDRRKDVNYNMLQRNLDTLILPSLGLRLPRRIDQARSLPEIFERIDFKSLQRRESHNLSNDKKDKETQRMLGRPSFTEGVFGSESMQRQPKQNENSKSCSNDEEDSILQQSSPVASIKTSDSIKNCLSHIISDATCTPHNSSSQSAPSLVGRSNSNGKEIIQGMKLLEHADIFSVSNLQVISVDDIRNDNDSNGDTSGDVPDIEDNVLPQDGSKFVSYNEKRKQWSCEDYRDSQGATADSSNLDKHFAVHFHNISQGLLKRPNKVSNTRYLQLNESNQEKRKKSESCPKVCSPPSQRTRTLFSSADNLPHKSHRTPKHIRHMPKFWPHYKHPVHKPELPYQRLHQTSRQLGHSASSPNVPALDSNPPCVEKRLFLLKAKTPSSLNLSTSWQSCSAIESSCQFDNAKPLFPSTNVPPPSTSVHLSSNLDLKRRESSEENHYSSTNISPVTSRVLTLPSLCNSVTQSSSSSSSVQEEILNFTNITSTQQYNLSNTVISPCHLSTQPSIYLNSKLRTSTQPTPASSSGNLTTFSPTDITLSNSIENEPLHPYENKEKQSRPNRVINAPQN